MSRVDRVVTKDSAWVSLRKFRMWRSEYGNVGTIPVNAYRYGRESTGPYTEVSVLKGPYTENMVRDRYDQVGYRIRSANEKYWYRDARHKNYPYTTNTGTTIPVTRSFRKRHWLVPGLRIREVFVYDQYQYYGIVYENDGRRHRSSRRYRNREGSVNDINHYYGIVYERYP
jgi:hypothetical protein